MVPESVPMIVHFLLPYDKVMKMQQDEKSKLPFLQSKIPISQVFLVSTRCVASAQCWTLPFSSYTSWGQETAQWTALCHQGPVHFNWKLLPLATLCCRVASSTPKSHQTRPRLYLHERTMMPDHHMHLHQALRVLVSAHDFLPMNRSLAASR